MMGLQAGNSENVSKVKFLVPAGVGIVSLVSLIFFSWVLAGWEVNDIFVVNTSLILGSITVGWAVGILVSPLNSEEKAEFSQYTKAVAVFASGFLVAKFSEAVGVALSKEVVFTSIGGFRLVSSCTAFLVALLLMYGWRRYPFAKPL